MPSEVVPDATLTRVTPVPGKGALGTWRSRDGQRRKPEEPCSLRTSLGVNRSRPGWYASQRLASSAAGRPSEESQGQNRNREIRPSGIVGGPGES